MDAIATSADLAAPPEPELPAPPAWLAAEAWVLRPPPRDELRYVMREEAGLLLDRLLVRVARGRGALELAMGAGLAALAVGDRALQLGYASIGDYARERLDLAPRTAQGMARLARELRSRPLLRAAVWSGEVSARKAEAVLSAAGGDAEAEWVARARTETLRALEAAVRGRGGADDADVTWERIDIGLSEEDRAVIDEALDLAGKALEQPRPPKWRRIEVMCQEFLAAHPAEPQPADADASAGEAVRTAFEEIKAGLEIEMKAWRWLDEAHAALAPRDRGPGPHVPAPVPASAEEPWVDVRHLDTDLRRIAAMRRSWDELLGHLAMLLQWTGLWRDMGFASLGHYSAERLGMAERTVEQRTAFERKLYALPRLREAMRAGRLSYEKARIVASVADEATLDGWIAEAERSTVVALRRLADDRDEAQMRARRSLSLRVPHEVGVLLGAAFRAARAAEKRWLTPGECLVRVARHFIGVWKAVVPARCSRAQKVLARDRHVCQVPGCSRAAAHAHHIVPRSAGGSDDASNLVALCAAHHLLAVHGGHVRVRGRAPDALIWELGRGFDGAPLQTFAAAAVH